MFLPTNDRSTKSPPVSGGKPEGFGPFLRFRRKTPINGGPGRPDLRKQKKKQLASAQRTPTQDKYPEDIFDKFIGWNSLSDVS